MDAGHPHIGHRKRVKEEFLKNGLENLPPHRVLELMLFYAIPQKDTNELAHRLENRFGSLAGVLDAPYEELLKVEGVGENTAVFLRLFTGVTRRYYLEKADTAPAETPKDALGERLKAWYIGHTKEVLVLVTLDNRLKVIHIDEVKSGVADAVQIQFRELARIALSRNATKVILAHNHPSGLILPSYNDRVATEKLYDRFKELGIELLDHFVIAGNEYLSMRESGIFPGNDI